jgi:type VI secretion system secreted protein VgrG
VRRFELREGISAVYTLTIEALFDGPHLDLDDLLGDDCVLEIDRQADPQRVAGLVLAAEEIGRLSGRTHVHLEIGPALALLDQRVDSRAWQERSAPEILREVLEGPLAELGRAVSFDGLAADHYPRREYCVQYRESDLDFACRLMEEEGIAFIFEHGPGEAERLVLVDHNRGFPRLLAEDDALDVDGSGVGVPGREAIQSLRWGRRLTPTAVVQRAFKWERPSEPRASERSGEDLRGRRREVYEHDDRVNPDDAERLSTIKHERLTGPSQRARGASDATMIRAGGTLAIRGHDRGGEYLITAAIHRGECPEEAIAQAAPSAVTSRYTNTFECQPLSLPFRPILTKDKPKVAGVQTATVTGPPGEDVYCDEHGRIKLLPHWDRLSPIDESASWWVRVAQSLAGPGWGGLFIPRVGMEVVVDFIDGDPDRPLVVGCVYNGDNPPPYLLPDDKTKTTIKTSSTPGGGGFNELRFEDQAGAEEVFLHAQKDMNEVVNASRTASVGANDTTTVGANRTATIGANDTTTVGANKTVTVAANYTESCGAAHSVSVGAAESIRVGASQCVSVALAQSIDVGTAQSMTIGTDQSFTVGAAQTTTVGAAQTISVGADQTTTVAGNQTHAITGDQTHAITGNQTHAVTGDQTHVVSGAHTLAVTGAHTVSAQGAAQATYNAGAVAQITGDLGLQISGELMVDAGGNAVLKAARVVITGGDSTVVVEPGAVTIEGGCMVDVRSTGSVAVSGGADVTVTGGVVSVTGGSINLNC